jgi:hypothetical protein
MDNLEEEEVAKRVFDVIFPPKACIKCGDTNSILYVSRENAMGETESFCLYHFSWGDIIK